MENNTGTIWRTVVILLKWIGILLILGLFSALRNKDHKTEDKAIDIEWRRNNFNNSNSSVYSESRLEECANNYHSKCNIVIQWAIEKTFFLLFISFLPFLLFFLTGNYPALIPQIVVLSRSKPFMHNSLSMSLIDFPMVFFVFHKNAS